MHKILILYLTACIIATLLTFNQPALFYGHFSPIKVSLLYVNKGSQLLFAHNYATSAGGAIDIYFSASGAKSQDICPIQFIGPSGANLIFSLDELHLFDVNITFENNTVGTSNSLNSIYANVFYICSWIPDTLTQYDFDLDASPVNGTRNAVYHEVFNFVPKGSTNNHLLILASLPCPCNSSGDYDAVYCMTAAYNNTLKLSTPIIIGRSFQLSLVGLNAVGSVGITDKLYSDVFALHKGDGTLTLEEGQNYRRTSVTTNKACTPIYFTVYGMQSHPPITGILSLSFVRRMQYEFHVNFDSCPVGFSYQRDKNSDQYSCACGEFLKSEVDNNFDCNSQTGVINHNNHQSWLSVSGDKVEYVKLCLPTYCNSNVSSFILSDPNIDTLLCDNNHAGRACGACIEGYSRVFGSSSCKQCSNTWLATIVLYCLLGVLLVFILFVLRLTITVGAINGVIFFCNVMSINKNLFFNENQFSFLRVFISLINLDLGFNLYFYSEMTQIAKTGLQFVFPIYLWLLIMIIIFTERFHFRRKISSYSVVPVFATLILLSYSKLLRTTISVFSFVTIHYTSNEGNYSVSQSVITWLPDSSVKYLQGWHCVLFVVLL